LVIDIFIRSFDGEVNSADGDVIVEDGDDSGFVDRVGDLSSAKLRTNVNPPPSLPLEL
jgi:hypothetical protein